MANFRITRGKYHRLESERGRICYRPGNVCQMSEAEARTYGLERLEPLGEPAPALRPTTARAVVSGDAI